MPNIIDAKPIQLPNSQIVDANNRVQPYWSRTLATSMASGLASSDIIDMGTTRNLRATLDISAVTGTNPTLDVSFIHSADCKSWTALGSALTQETGAFGSVSAVTSSGTTPPALTLSGTAVRECNFKATVDTAGARGTAVLKIALDGGRWYYLNWTTAASYLLLDEDGVSTGVTLAYANASANADNVWTWRTLGRQRVALGPCNRFVRAIYAVGGTDTPAFTGRLGIEI
jgi:hypothetical protein